MSIAATLLALFLSSDEASLQGCAWSEQWAPLAKDNRDLLGGRAPESQTPPRLVKSKFTPPRPAPGSSYALDGPWIVEMVLSREGKVLDAKIVRHPADPPWPEYDQALLSAVRKWKFKPSMIDGNAVGICVAIPVVQR